jgi:CRP-like cAMP-binding protein
MLLFAQGEYAMKMYYIIQGEVRAKAKFGNDKAGGMGGAIIRSGCIIGENNLLFSYPYSTAVVSRLEYFSDSSHLNN